VCFNFLNGHSCAGEHTHANFDFWVVQHDVPQDEDGLLGGVVDQHGRQADQVVLGDRVAVLRVVQPQRNPSLWKHTHTHTHTHTLLLWAGTNTLTRHMGINHYKLKRASNLYVNQNGSFKFILKKHFRQKQPLDGVMVKALTCAGVQLHIQEVLEATVLLQDAGVGHGYGGEEEAALLVAGRAVGDHREHVKVAALAHLLGHLDDELEALLLLAVEELVEVVRLLEGLALLL